MDGYYNSLLSFIDKAVEEDFISPSARHIIVSAPTPKELVKKLEVKLFYFYYFFLFSNILVAINYPPKFRICIALFQEYFPRHEGVASKLNWEIEQLGYSPKCDISR